MNRAEMMSNFQLLPLYYASTQNPQVKNDIYNFLYYIIHQTDFDVNQVDSEYHTILINAILSRDAEILELLLTCERLDVNQQVIIDLFGISQNTTPLDFSLECINQEAFIMLLNRSDIELTENIAAHLIIKFVSGETTNWAGGGHPNRFLRPYPDRRNLVITSYPYVHLQIISWLPAFNAMLNYENYLPTAVQLMIFFTHAYFTDDDYDDDFTFENHHELILNGFYRINLIANPNLTLYPQDPDTTVLLFFCKELSNLDTYLNRMYNRITGYEGDYQKVIQYLKSLIRIILQVHFFEYIGSEVINELAGNLRLYDRNLAQTIYEYYPNQIIDLNYVGPDGKSAWDYPKFNKIFNQMIDEYSQ